MVYGLYRFSMAVCLSSSCYDAFLCVSDLNEKVDLIIPLTSNHSYQYGIEFESYVF